MLKGLILWLAGSVAVISAIVIAMLWSQSEPTIIRWLVTIAIVVGTSLIIVLANHAINRPRDVQGLVKEALERQRQIDARRITLEQIEEAKRIQEQSKLQDLGQVLQSLGMTGERELMEARASEMGFPFVDLERIRPDLEAITSVPLDLIKKHRILPIKREGNQIWIAMENVNDIKAQDDIREVTGLKVNPCMCVPESLEKAIVKLEKT